MAIPAQQFKTMWFSGGLFSAENTPYASFPYTGQLGGKMILQDGTAGSGGLEIQLVEVDSAVPTTPSAGDVAWWSDEANKKVTTLATQAGRVAGVFGTTLTAATFGNRILTYIVKQGLFLTRILNAPTVAPDTLGKQIIPSATNGQADCVNAAASVLYVFGRSAGTQDGVTFKALVDLKVADVA